MSEPGFVREDIFAALFALVSEAADFETATRRMKVYSAVASGQQPALLQTELGEKWNAPPGTPPVVTLACAIFIYCEQPDPLAAVSTILNPLLDAVMNAIAPDPFADELQTLGGLVAHCRIAGDVKIAEGLGGQCEAVIPVEILVNH
ncbi:MAG: hypothetical protein ABSC92_16145 [Rhizomicrobium sp.]|jgi:hypothetical protein